MSQLSRSVPLTDEQIMSAACNAADALDATRVHEMKNGAWHPTTIFDGDSGLLRFGRLVEQAINAAASEKQACKATPSSYGGGAAQDQRWNCEECGDVTDTARCPKGRQNETLAALAAPSSERAIKHPQNHEQAQARIAECVREIEMIADSFGYDQTEWLTSEEDVAPASATSPSNALVEACRGLVSYWTRNLRTFQWEKADDHVKRINAALPGATEGRDA